MTFKNRKRKKELTGKAMDELTHAPQYAWVKGKLIQTDRDGGSYDRPLH
jgi:hypothetical protein